MTIDIDFATADDLGAMADLLTELFTLESDFKPEPLKQRRGLQLILDNPVIGQLFVVRDGNTVVGMANALITVSTAEGCKVVLLEDVIIHPDYRGRALGQRLIAHILDWASANGIPRVTLLADKDNTPALAFYAKLGFDNSAMRVLRRTVAPRSL